MEKPMVTGLIFIPTANFATNVFDIVNQIAQQLGYLNCEASDDTATITYKGVISREHKDTLNEIAENNNFTIMFIEAEYETPFIKIDTIILPEYVIV